MLRDLDAVWRVIRDKVASAKHRWSVVTGPLSNLIATLLDMNFRPVSPTRWIDELEGGIWELDLTQGLFEFREVLVDRLCQQLWTRSANRHLGEGLRTRPHAHLMHRHFVKLERANPKRALQYLRLASAG